MRTPPLITMPAEHWHPSLALARCDGTAACETPGYAVFGRTHAHAFTELLYVEEGAGRCVVGGQTYLAEAGSVFHVPALVAHDPCGLIERDARFWILNHCEAPALRVAMGPSRVPEFDRQRWNGWFEEMQRDLISGDAFGIARATERGRAVFAAYLRVARKPAEASRTANDSYASQTLQYIDANFGSALTLRAIADHVGVHPEHLRKTVREATGRTVATWLSRRRLAEARRLLVTTHAPIAEVAYRCGYRDAGYFSRHFGQICGQQPRVWRALMTGRSTHRKARNLLRPNAHGMYAIAEL